MIRNGWPKALALFGMMLASGAASAGLLPVNWSVTPEAGNFRWSYAIVLPTDSQLKTGDYFTIYDFAGFVPGSAVSPDDAGWTFTSQNVGVTPPLVLPTDDPTLPNLTWQYVGPTIDVGSVGLGNFMATSAYETPTDSFFTARTHRASDGRVDTNITSVDVPVPTRPTDTPEPAPLALAALGLPLVLAAGFFRRRTVG